MATYSVDTRFFGENAHFYVLIRRAFPEDIDE